MNKKYISLSQRIRRELEEIERSVNRIKKAWNLISTDIDSLYLDSVALNLHNFYSGIERIFELIAEVIDEIRPSSSSWHQELLTQMSIDIPGVRPAVISQEIKDILDEYRAFRHLVRNIYTHRLKVDKLQGLVENIDDVFERVRISLISFCTFLEKLGE